MSQETAKTEEEEIVEDPEQYWVNLSDIESKDMEDIVNLYADYKKKDISHFDLPNFEEFSRAMSLQGAGYEEWELGFNVGSLEARRRLGPDGRIFVRFKIRVFLNTTSAGYVSPHVKRMQERIDQHFVDKGVAIPLAETF